MPAWAARCWRSPQTTPTAPSQPTALRLALRLVPRASAATAPATGQRRQPGAFARSPTRGGPGSWAELRLHEGKRFAQGDGSGLRVASPLVLDLAFFQASIGNDHPVRYANQFPV